MLPKNELRIGPFPLAAAAGSARRCPGEHRIGLRGGEGDAGEHASSGVTSTKTIAVTRKAGVEGKARPGRDDSDTALVSLGDHRHRHVASDKRENGTGLQRRPSRRTGCASVRGEKDDDRLGDPADRGSERNSSRHREAGTTSFRAAANEREGLAVRESRARDDANGVTSEPTVSKARCNDIPLFR